MCRWNSQAHIHMWSHTLECTHINSLHTVTDTCTPHTLTHTLSHTQEHLHTHMQACMYTRLHMVTHVEACTQAHEQLAYACRHMHLYRLMQVQMCSRTHSLPWTITSTPSLHMDAHNHTYVRTHTHSQRQPWVHRGSTLC